jgi:hypothetical protein
MRFITILGSLALASVLCGSAVCASPAPPAAKAPPNPEVVKIEKEIREFDRLKEEAHTRAVVKIERPEGVCYWQVMGADALLRLPLKKDAGFGTLLLSAKLLKGSEVQLSVAGEREPLETTALGRFNLSVKSAATGEKDREDPQVRIGDHALWKLSLISPGAFFKGGVSGCCSCALYKVTCCPSAGSCMGCGTCGDCCGD